MPTCSSSAICRRSTATSSRRRFTRAVRRQASPVPAPTTTSLRGCYRDGTSHPAPTSPTWDKAARRRTQSQAKERGSQFLPESHLVQAGILVHPLSRGSVHIRSADISDAPAIDPGTWRTRWTSRRWRSPCRTCRGWHRRGGGASGGAAADGVAGAVGLRGPGCREVGRATPRHVDAGRARCCRPRTCSLLYCLRRRGKGRRHDPRRITS